MSDIQKDKLFSAANIVDIKRAFKEADEDGSGGLDEEEFCDLMVNLCGSVSKAELICLHWKIDANGDGTVDLGELMDFLLSKNKASDKMDSKHIAFPKSIKVIPSGHYKKIIRILWRPFEDDSDPDENPDDEVRTYQKGQYLTISSDGVLNYWSDSFDSSDTITFRKKETTLPFEHNKKSKVTDMVYIKELQQLAVSTTDRELKFYNSNEISQLFSVSHSLIVEDNIVTTLNYWSDDTKGMFSFGDDKGFLYVFVCHNIRNTERISLFCSDAFEKISLKNYPVLYVSKLLKRPPRPDFWCAKVHIFGDTCSQIQYFPKLNLYAVCGGSSKTMVLAALPDPHTAKLNVFESEKGKDFFTCVEYCQAEDKLVTGGTDGLLRVWFPHKTKPCNVLKGHEKPVTNIMFNHDKKILISLSEDNNVRVWTQNGWLCRQSFYVEGMGRGRISSVCYNSHNNELILANTNIGKYLGRGTDVFRDSLTSHDAPLCSVLYHSIFKQVVSVCQNGVVTVSDILTGQAVMQFKVTPAKSVGHTAIAFDELQRKLITVSQDGILRMWNFNNGTELDVIPVTLPREVTGIVCVKDRVFVSGRNSRYIFNLDIKDYDHKIWQHDNLEDISSMDFHENLLFTVSSSGNTVIWNIETADVCYSFKESQSPRIFWADKKHQGLTMRLSKNNLNRVTDSERHSQKCLTGDMIAINRPSMLALKTREVTPSTATLLTSADGYISAWSVKSKGGLIAKFRAVTDEGAVITAMSTNVNEKILLTGDSTGKICLWDIKGFGFKETSQGPFNNINGWFMSLCPPPLLASWQSHLTRVVSIQCDPTCENIITAGLDCNVQLWTNRGRCIGVFGKDEWDATQLCSGENADQEEAGITGTKETRHFKGNKKIKHHSLKGNADSKPRMAILDSPVTHYKDLCTEIQEFTAPGVSSDQVHLRSKNAPIISDEKQQSAGAFKKGPKEPSVRSKILKTLSQRIQFPTPVNTVQLNASERQFEPHPPQTPLIRGGIDTPPGNLGSEQTPGHVRFPSIRDRVMRTHGESKFKPHPPQTSFIEDGTDRTQGLPMTASSNSSLSRPTYGREVKIQQKEPLKDFVLTPCPPNTLGNQRSAQTPKHVNLPPVNTWDRLTHTESQLKPQPPQTSLAGSGIDCTQSSPISAFLKLNQTRSKYERELKIQKRAALKDFVLTPCQSNALGSLGSGQPPEHVRLPPIHDKVQLIHSESKFKPQPPQTPLIRGGTDRRQSSPTRASLKLNQIRSKYGRELKLQQSEALKDFVLTPCPPNAKSALKTSSHMRQQASTVKCESEHTKKQVRFPPISEKVQLTTAHTNALKSSPRFSSRR
ncbi:WD repeat-containing protein on Y chromosome-like [Plectropomus leopardus]|uniref:WD repeat-containing protein on Y chromosome-like n=1 Tax=Plectropomus leopardus TaxID=160734 RepID=UPI001C4C3D07|nr:WD repeat-containing protein on Y chromosome-like [Plectropomus leopardus]